MTLRDQVALLIADHEKRCENPWGYQDAEQCADTILALPDLRVGLCDTAAMTAAIAEFEEKGMDRARGILAWHIRKALVGDGGTAESPPSPQ